MDDLVKELIAKKFDIEKSLINDQTSLTFLAEDSLGKIDLLFDLEDEVGVRIPHDQVVDIGTVGDLIAVLKSNKEKQ
jgi:acyl carrier protein